MDAKQLERHQKRKDALFQELNSLGWRTRYEEISKFIVPRLGRFLTTDANRLKSTQFSSIIDQTGCRAHRILASGLMSSKSSKAMPWFRLTIDDKDLMQYWPVREWLFKLQNLFQDTYAQSNTYRALQNIYDEMTAFGTAPCLIDRDLKNIIHLTPLTVGEYAMSVDAKGDVNAMYREFDWKVHQVVEEFGIDNCSVEVKGRYDRGDYDSVVKIVHGICPRYDRDPKKIDNKNMPFESVYYEVGSKDKPLRESGYRTFPGVAPRWDVLGRDSYGVSPSMYALGMVKSLQHKTITGDKAIDWQTNPALAFPTSLRGEKNRVIPGGAVYTDTLNANAKITSLFDVHLDLQHLQGSIQDVRNMVNEAFYVDLFMMVSNMDRSGVTAREIAEKHEEKLLMLGSVDMRMDYELFDKLIDQTFDLIMDTRLPGNIPLMPPPPPEMQGMELKVEYVSVLSQAQKLIGLQSIDRVLGIVGVLAPIKPEIVDKINADQIIDIASDMLGVDPSVIVSDQNVSLIRKGRAQQAQQQEQAAMVGTIPGAMKDMGAAAQSFASAHEGGNLTDLLSSVPGMGNPQV